MKTTGMKVSAITCKKLTCKQKMRIEDTNAGRFLLLEKGRSPLVEKHELVHAAPLHLKPGRA